MTYVRNAWIDPEGRVYDVEDYSHQTYARRLIEGMGLPTHDVQYHDFSGVLFRAGWIEVSESRANYAYTTSGRMTESQIDCLWEIYMHLRSMHADKYASLLPRYVTHAIEGLRIILHIGGSES